MLATTPHRTIKETQKNGKTLHSQTEILSRWYQFSTWSTDIRELLKFQWPFAEREVTLKKQSLGLVTLASTPSHEQGLCREGKLPGTSHFVISKIQAGVRLSRKILSFFFLFFKRPRVLCPKV